MSSSSAGAELLVPGDAGRGGSGGATGPAAMPARVYVTGMGVAVCGIVMFFAALISASIVRRGLGANDWRPLEIPPVLWLNSAILLASSALLARARWLLRTGDEDGFRHWWCVTTVLGLMFVAGQLIAWRQMAAAGLHLAARPSASFFYVFTAAHGLHLLGGIAALLFVSLRPASRPAMRMAPDTATLDTMTRVVAIYWHFLTTLWIFLLLFFVWERYS